MSNKDFRRAFEKAEKTEKLLIKYYKKYFIKHTKKLNTLYESHINSLKNIDGSIGSLNSMVKLFQENLPNAMKKKKISVEGIQRYLDSNNLKLSEYAVNSSTTKLDFAEQHVLKQLKLIENEFFSDMTENVKSMNVVFLDKDEDSTSMVRKGKVKEGNLYLLGMKRKKKVEGANIINRHNLIIKIILILKDGRMISSNIPHKNNLRIDKKEGYDTLKRLFAESLEEQKRMSLKDYVKEQDKKLKSIIFEEQKKKLEDQLDLLEKDKDNQKVLLNIVKKIYSTSDYKFAEDKYFNNRDRDNRYYRRSSPRLGNNNNNLLERRLTREMTKPLSKETNGENEDNIFAVQSQSPFKQKVEVVEDAELKKLFGTKKSKKKTNNNNNNNKKSKKK